MKFAKLCNQCKGGDGRIRTKTSKFGHHHTCTGCKALQSSYLQHICTRQISCKFVFSSCETWSNPILYHFKNEVMHMCAWYVVSISGVANSINTGAHIHIFVFTYHKNNRFQKKLIVQNMNIWIWAPSLIEFATPLVSMKRYGRYLMNLSNYWSTSVPTNRDPLLVPDNIHLSREKCDKEELHRNKSPSTSEN